MNDPSILLADEPTGALDSRTTEDILALFGDLHGEGQTVIVVTHEAEVAARAARRLNMKDGLIVDDSAGPLLATYNAAVGSTSAE